MEGRAPNIPHSGGRLRRHFETPFSESPPIIWFFQLNRIPGYQQKLPQEEEAVDWHSAAWCLELVQQSLASHDGISETANHHFTDPDGQRVLIVDREWVLEAAPKSLRAWLWPQKMRVWCAEELELPCGTMYRGTTLMASTANADVPTAELPEDHGWICAGFGQPYKEAVRMMLLTSFVITNFRRI